MISVQAVAALKDNYIWVITNTKQGSALVVDPGDATPVVHYLQANKLQLQGILLTHHHWDHVQGVAELIKAYSVPVFGAVNNAVSYITQRVSDGDSAFIHKDFPHFQVLAIPGHTLDHIAFYTEGHLFCGDTLFAAGCGRLFEGTAQQLYDSLQKIACLPDNTLIFCAHEYTLQNLAFAKTVEPSNAAIIARQKRVEHLRNQNQPSLPSTLLEEKQTNPFLRCGNTAIVQQVQSRTAHSLLNPVAVFTELRAWKDSF